MNFLERLIADWYGHQGYLVQTNLRFGKRAKGGYEGEIDVLGVNLREQALVHVETSADADSWDERRERILRKFKNAEKHYVAAGGTTTFKSITRLAVVGVRPPRKSIALDQIEIVSIDELMGRIKDYARKFNPAKQTIPENQGYLRAVQFSVWYGIGNDK